MLENLLDDATKILGIDGQYGELPGTGWIVGLREDEVMLVHLNEDGDRVAFEYDLGPLPEKNRVAALEAMLLFNYASVEFARLKTGISANKRAVLLFDMPAEGADATQAANTIAMMAENGAAWKSLYEETVDHGEPEAAAANPAPGQDFI